MCAHHGRRWPSPWPSRSCNHAHAQLRKRTQAIQEATDLEGWVLGALTLAPGRASTVGSAAASGSPPATPTGTASFMRFAAGCSTTPPSPSPSDRASLGGVVMARTTKHEAELYRERQLPKKQKKKRRCRGSNPGRPRDRREYSPLYYNDFAAPALKRILITFSSIFSICTTCQSIARISKLQPF